MPNRRKRRRDSTLTPAIVILNLLIIIILMLMVFFIYMYISSEEREPEERTTPTTTAKTSAPIGTSAPEITTEETSTFSMTKATTTTPAPVTEPPDEPVSTEGTAQAPQYSQSFFEDDLFIGDSIMTGFVNYGYLPSANVFAQVGFNPESVLEGSIGGLTLKEKAAAMSPARIYIMLGTNGIAFMSGSYMAGRMQELAEMLETASPASEIVILTIPPVTAAHDALGSETIADISAYNELLRELADDYYYTLVDISALLSDSSGYLAAQYAEQDGLHFLGAAYKAVLGQLQAELE